MFKRLDLMVINRSFWPIYPVIGEALMRFVEQQATAQTVGATLQDHTNIKLHLEEKKRGKNVQFFPCHAFSVSGSSILRRAADAVFFMLWVLFVLLLKRPRKVYVSTDPPVLVPFIVMIYCKCFKASFVYHLQDIHPEAANVVIPVHPVLFSTLRWMDSLSMRHADVLITITDQMANEIQRRSLTSVPVSVLSNPSVSFDLVNVPVNKRPGFTFCGNAGRLQRIPLLLSSIDKYCAAGGKLPFVFAGAGVFSDDLKQLAIKHGNVTYKGLVTPSEAAQLNADYEWALLPIEDEVTRFAFPSKSSSYVFSGANIAAICGLHTSVAQWVSENKLGVVLQPDAEVLCKFFFAVEKQAIDDNVFDKERKQLKEKLGFDVFVNKLTDLIVSKGQG